MKKYLTLTLAAFALLAISCKKEVAPEVNVPKDEPVATIEKTFIVNAPESGTKTEMNGSAQVVWSEGDQITVIAKTTGNISTFTLTEGAGTASAKFSGKIDASDAEETVFYAVYPEAATLNPEDSNFPFANGYLTLKSGLSQSIPAVEGGFSPSHAVMTAKLNAGGSFTFRHGAAYFKLTIAMDDVQSIKFSAPGKIMGRPSYEAETGAFAQLQGTKEDVTLTGPFVKGSTYYVPLMPHHKNKVGTLTLTFTDTEGRSASISTSSLSNTALELGKIYDLKSPTVSFEPVIVADDVTIAADATSGSIAYEITNASSSGVLTAEVESGISWLSVGSISEDSVNLVSEANTGSRRSATVTLTYTYGSKSVTKEVSVAQMANGSASIDYVWDFSSTEWQNALGAQASAACHETNGGSNVASWTVSYNGLTYTSGSSNGRWSQQGWIQPNGSGSKTVRVFSFTVEKAGTVSITASNTGNSVPTDNRGITVSDSAGDSTQKVLAPANAAEVYNFDVKAGNVYVFPAVKGIRFWKIEFHSN